MRCLDVAGVILGHFGLTDATAPAVEPDPPEEPDAHLLAQAAAWGFPAPPEAPAAWRAQALTSLAASVIGRDPAAAARIAGEALAVLPGDAFALRLRASALALDDQPDELPALSAALRLAIPGRGWAALAMGAYHVLRDETDLATPLLLEAETDRDPALLLIVAAAWVALARPAAAERVFTAVVALDPANVPARIGLAVGALGRRDFLEVESLLAALMRDDPGNPAVYIQWAHLCRLTGRPEQAMRMATLAIAAGAETAHIETLRMAGLAT